MHEPAIGVVLQGDGAFDAGFLNVVFRGLVPPSAGHIWGGQPKAVEFGMYDDAGTLAVTRIFNRENCGSCHAHYFDGGNVGPCP